MVSHPHPRGRISTTRWPEQEGRGHTSLFALLPIPGWLPDPVRRLLCWAHRLVRQACWTRKDKGSGSRILESKRWLGAAADLQRCGSQQAEWGKKARLSPQRCEMLCAVEARGRLEHPRPRLTPAARSWARSRALQATRRRRGLGSRDCCWRRGGARGGRGATEQGEAGRLLLLPGCKIKRVLSGQVVTRRVAWRRSSSSQAPGRGWLRLPHPPPAPSPARSSGGFFSPLPRSSGSWAGPSVPRPQR